MKKITLFTILISLFCLTIVSSSQAQSSIDNHLTWYNTPQPVIHTNVDNSQHFRFGFRYDDATGRPAGKVSLTLNGVDILNRGYNQPLTELKSNCTSGFVSSMIADTENTTEQNANKYAIQVALEDCFLPYGHYTAVATVGENSITTEFGVFSNTSDMVDCKLVNACPPTKDQPIEITPVEECSNLKPRIVSRTFRFKDVFKKNSKQLSKKGKTKIKTFLKKANKSGKSAQYPFANHLLVVYKNKKDTSKVSNLYEQSYPQTLGSSNLVHGKSYKIKRDQVRFIYSYSVANCK